MIRPEVFEWVAAELSEAALRMKKDGLYPADIDYIMSHVTAEIRAQALISEYGCRGEHPEYGEEDWLEGLVAGDYRIGYWRWVVCRLEEKKKEKADEED